jgi:hypothetical protein
MLHSFALEQGLDYHDLKPMVSALFPLNVGPAMSRGRPLPSIKPPRARWNAGGQGSESGITRPIRPRLEGLSRSRAARGLI